MFRIPSAIPPFQPFQSRIRHAHKIALEKSFNLKKEFLKLSKNWGSYDCFCKITHVRRIINWFLLQFQLNPLTIIAKSLNSWTLFSQNSWDDFQPKLLDNLKQNSWVIFSQDSQMIFSKNSCMIFSQNSFKSFGRESSESRLKTISVVGWKSSKHF